MNESNNKLNKQLLLPFLLIVFSQINLIQSGSKVKDELDEDTKDLKKELAEDKKERDKELNKCLPIHDASLNNDISLLSKILSKKGSPDAIGCFWEMTPIQYIIFKNEKKKNSLLVNTVEWLLKNGAHDLEHKESGFGRTALHLAAMYNQPEIIHLLMQHGARQTAEDDDMMTPLHLAAQYDNVDACQALIEEKVPLSIEKHDPDIKDAELDPLSLPIHIAGYTSSINVLDLFVNKYHQDINIQDNLGDTPLHYAAISLNEQTVKWLLDNHADKSIRNKAKKTALNVAAANLKSLYDKYKKEESAKEERNFFANFLQEAITDKQKKMSKNIVEQMGLSYPEEMIVSSEDDIRNNPIVQLLLPKKN